MAVGCPWAPAAHAGTPKSEPRESTHPRPVFLVSMIPFVPSQMRCIAFLFCAFLALATVSGATGEKPGNILILLADDIGVEALQCTAVGRDCASTPVLDKLASEGVVFANAWSAPLCGPTRACIQTGRHAFRTGIGSNLTLEGMGLPLSEVILPEMLDVGTQNFYTHAAFGKWHLANDQVGGIQGPNLAGYGFYSGFMNSTAEVEDYFSWTEVTNGVESSKSGYLSTSTANLASQWIAAQNRPWMCYVAFHAAHAPLHSPPAELTTQVAPHFPPTNFEERRAFFKLMVEAMDTSIGQLLDSLGDDLGDTTIIFMGDNGTANGWISNLYGDNQSKSTLFQGGVNVPLIVRGPAVAQPGSRSQALVHAVDIFATVAELAGVDLQRALPDVILDSISLVPYLEDPTIASKRNAVYCERFKPNGAVELTVDRKAVRNRRYKLIDLNGQRQFFDLYMDPFEKVNLLRVGLTPEEQFQYTQLDFELDHVAAAGEPYLPSLPDPYQP